MLSLKSFHPLNSQNWLYNILKNLILKNYKKECHCLLVKFVDVINTDFKKAFDTVNHDLLINILKSLDIGNPFLSWFQSYMSGRKQFVKIMNSIPERTEVPSGVS